MAYNHLLNIALLLNEVSRKEDANFESKFPKISPEFAPNQEARKGGFSKGGFCRIQCHTQDDNNTQGYWARECIWHSERHSQERRTFLQTPFRKPPLFSMPNMTGRPGYWTMEMTGGSSAPYLARTPCVPLFSTSFNRDGNRRAFRLPGAGGDHLHCALEPPPSHIRCRFSWF